MPEFLPSDSEITQPINIQASHFYRRDTTPLFTPDELTAYTRQSEAAEPNNKEGQEKAGRLFKSAMVLGGIAVASLAVAGGVVLARGQPTTQPTEVGPPLHSQEVHVSETSHAEPERTIITLEPTTLPPPPEVPPAIIPTSPEYASTAPLSIDLKLILPFTTQHTEPTTTSSELQPLPPEQTTATPRQESRITSSPTRSPTHQTTTPTPTPTPTPTQETTVTTTSSSAPTPTTTSATTASSTTPPETVKPTSETSSEPSSTQPSQTPGN